MTRFLLLVALAVFSLSAPSAFAQMQDPILTLPDGQVILSISATEREEVDQDLLVATLSYVAKNSDPAQLQDEINKAMKKAVELAKKEKSLKVSTGSYQVYEQTDPRTKQKYWHGAQSLTIKSKEAETVLDVTGKLQEMKLTMNGLSYMLAPETAVAVQDGLMEKALTQLQTRADRAAKALGKSSAELRDVQVQSNGNIAQPMYAPRAMMMKTEAAMDMAAPVAEAGETTITLSVSARAILKP